MDKLPSTEYCQGYIRALLDVEGALQFLESDLLRRKRRITVKILHQGLREIQKNSANLREGIGFLRWNYKLEKPEWYIPIRKRSDRK